MEAQTTIIEINGIKLEVDLRSAKRIDQLKVGSRVKCLVKGYSGMSTHAGVVVGFEPFLSLPTIVVAYLDPGYVSGTLIFKTFNAETKDFEIVADLDNNSLEVSKVDILKKFEHEIRKLQQDIELIEQKKAYFLSNFGTYFSDASAIKS